MLTKIITSNVMTFAIAITIVISIYTTITHHASRPT